MQWLVADMTNTRAVFPDGECFEVALDKGTLDAMLCTDDGSALYCEVRRSRVPGARIAVQRFARVACRHASPDGTGTGFLAVSRRGLRAGGCAARLSHKS